MLLNNIKKQKSSKGLLITAITLGGALEWYEIGLFFFWPLIIQENLQDYHILVMAIIGVIARGLGGWIFGKIGDQKGRLKAFPLGISIAALPNLFVGIFSFYVTYEVWITYSVIIFAIIKFVQSLTAGGELSGAICYLSENFQNSSKETIDSEKRYRCSYALLGPQIGLALSYGVCLILREFYSKDVLLTQGWKIVFLSAGIMGSIVYSIRKHFQETIDFKKSHSEISSKPIITIFNKLKPQFIFGWLISIFEIAAFSVLTIMPIYYSKKFNLTEKSITYMCFGSSFCCILFLLLIGKLSSRFMKFPWLSVSAWGTIILSLLICFTIQLKFFITSIIINILLVFLFSIQAAILPSILAQIFPVNVRYTGIALSFNICDAFLWSLLTNICSELIFKNNNPYFILIITGSAAFFLIIHNFYKQKKEFAFIS